MTRRDLPRFLIAFGCAYEIAAIIRNNNKKLPTISYLVQGGRNDHRGRIVILATWAVATQHFFVDLPI